MKFLQNIILAATVGSFIFLTACNSSEANDPAKEGEAAEAHVHGVDEAMVVALTADQYKNAGIETGKVETRPLTGTVKVNGVLDLPPQNLFSISAPTAGFLKKSDLLQGSRVRKGQVIAVLYNPEFIVEQREYLEARQELAAVRSQLEYAEAEYRRQEELARENVNAGKTLQAAKAEFYSLKAKIGGLEAKTGGQRARFKLLGINADRLSADNFQSEINLYSPANGYVTEVNVNVGKYVGNTEVLFKIADTEHIHAELTVFEKDIPKLKIGQTVRFTLANETKERLAKIYLFGREISADRSIQVHCHLLREDKDLLPGMYFKAVVETGATPVHALPEAAIVSSEGKNYIFVVTTAAEAEAPQHEEGGKEAEEQEHEPQAEHHFRMVEVKRGVTDGAFVEVGLPEDFDVANSLVVTDGAFYLLSAAKSGGEEDE
ncbi:MAG: efflux RND transporter periplasmic adaptor subunit [Lewinellaceae bacterium]|nr:efflux RND transporter periplasmic adaptor subunit [Saprospiraceae bacterium]MCB9341737.1 efflux RND transporter periplasmic adaptor subunit [Lewinellaceae bacterium]